MLVFLILIFILDCMISVCIATYNGGKFLFEQLQSILCQLGKDDEVIISDDGSTDNTYFLVMSMRDNRIKFYQHQSDSFLLPHEKATLNFEHALKYAKGDYIFLSDQDDVWVENKVEIMCKYLRYYSYVVSDCYITDSNLNIIANTRFNKKERITKNKYLAVVWRTPYQGSCAAFRREVLMKALPFPPKIQSHDRWIGNVAAFYFSVKLIPEKLIYYRRHESNTSTSSEGKSNICIMKRIQYRLCYIKGLLQIINR